MTDRAHPAQLPGYQGGPLTHQPELLEEHLFWLEHLHSGLRGADEEELLLGAHYESAEEFSRDLHERADWPAFAIPLRAGHRFHVVYRTFAEDPGVDYLLHHPDWDRAERLAKDEGCFMGPALSWPELIAAADNGLPGGSTEDPHARLLLLLPAFADSDLPSTAVARLASALAARTRVDEPDALAAALLAAQNQWGRSRWSSTEGGVRVSKGKYSYRNPFNHFVLPADRLARVSAALSP